ncbi:MAG: hypothetical protein ACI8RD_007468 [Bacillariaceae sp.]
MNEINFCDVTNVVVVVLEEEEKLSDVKARISWWSLGSIVLIKFYYCSITLDCIIMYYLENLSCTGLSIEFGEFLVFSERCREEGSQT